VDLSGLTLELDSGVYYSGFPLGGPATTCFPRGASVLLAEDPTQDVTLFGGGQGLTNEHVLRADNAAIARRLTGASKRLVWYVPDPSDAAADETVGLGSLLPDWVAPGLWLGALALIGVIA